MHELVEYAIGFHVWTNIKKVFPPRLVGHESGIRDSATEESWSMAPSLAWWNFEEVTNTETHDDCVAQGRTAPTEVVSHLRHPPQSTNLHAILRFGRISKHAAKWALCKARALQQSENWTPDILT